LIFKLKLNIQNVDRKYGIQYIQTDILDPHLPITNSCLPIVCSPAIGTTVITDLKTQSGDQPYGSNHRCTMINRLTGNPPSSSKNLCCYWDTEPIDNPNQILGCPIDFIPTKVVQTFCSEQTNEKYDIHQYVPSVYTNDEKNNNEHIKFTGEYYLTDGIFCSKPCVLAFINDNIQNPIYSMSEFLLHKMCAEIYGADTQFFPAPHWRLLTKFGGYMSTLEFRNCCDKIFEPLTHPVCKIPVMRQSGSIFFESYFLR
jgi:hypothetical protein